MFFLQTERLVLRRWRESDVAAFAELNADPAVMEFFPSLLTYEQSKSMIERVERGFEQLRFGLWAIENKESNRFIGFVGLNQPTFDADFMPCVEIGWRLARSSWGNGFAQEAALEALRDGFERCSLQEIVSFTAVSNERSIRVMEQLKMRRSEEDDFLHPAIPDDHPLKPHVLYRMNRSDWNRIHAFKS